MTRPMRTRSIVAVSTTLLAIAALDACSNDSTSPKASVRADTVAVAEQNTVLVEKDRVNGVTSYDVEATIYASAFVDTQQNSGAQYEWRLAFSVALPSLSGNAIVDSARFYQHVCVVNGPVDNSIVLDHLDWGASYTVAEAFEGAALTSNIGTIVSDTSTGWKSLLVTSSVQADYAAKRATSEYRERFDYTTFPVSSNTYVQFGPVSCGQPESGQPYLVVWSH